MSKKIFMHAGAHRTGTSSFQLCLSANRDILGQRGYDLAYPERDGAPDGGLKLKLPGRNPNAALKRELIQRARDHLQDLSPDPERALILSEENIPGRMLPFYKGEFFPTAWRRFQILRKALPAPVEHLIYVVRPYSELFISAFRKRSEDNAVGEFSEIAALMADFDGGWPKLIADMRDNLGAERITVIDYGNRGSSRDLLSRLIGVDKDQLIEPERSLNVSATDAALLALQKRYHAGEVLVRDDWQAVIRAHAGDREDRGYSKFTQAQARKLGTRYEQDLKALAALDGVNCDFG